MFARFKTFSLSYNYSDVILSETNAELCKYSKTADNPEAVANTKGCH